ncbi:hypothetical protein PAHAL_9G176100 [Panicum hallii]|jgi:hypothetical protein|uniref:Uncharacterized protein n=1 Tax=Panicum hallii TaxID=206008 RepID=A0A2S3IKG6_9POAL|nr:serine/arginine repetitive matrix protein 1-like [Panicum hallii]PAN46310.1 hypothetical protein PAHAL_9G176100 [Panicum hallii]
MGSCVSKKAARAGAGARGKVAAPLPVTEKESAHALPPVAEVDAAEEEEVKEVVLSEAPAPRPPPEPVKRRQQEQPEAEEESAPSEACSASDGTSVESAAKAKAKLQKLGVEREAEKRAAADAPGKKGRTAPEERESRPRGGGSTANGRARSPSPSSAHRRQQHPPEPRPRRREQPPVVSGIGCRSGRFSPSAARRAAESTVRRTHSAREADMALSSKRSLTAAINGNAGGCYGGGGVLSRRDPGERSGRRSDSPTTGRRAPASPGATHRPASPARKAAKEQRHGSPEPARPRARDGGDAGSGGEGERKKVAEGEQGALGQNPSVAMECFIFL